MMPTSASDLSIVDNSDSEWKVPIRELRAERRASHHG